MLPEIVNVLRWVCLTINSNNMDSNAASDEIKSLAINGLLADVETKFGKKKAAKTICYVEAKLQSLKEKQKAGQALDHVLYATPFMLFAMTKDGREVFSS